MNRILWIAAVATFLAAVASGQQMNVHTGDTIQHFQLAEIDSITFDLAEPVDFPVEAEVFLDHTFTVCEGIAFNGEGELYVAGNAALWHVTVDGQRTQIASGFSNLGLAPIGDRDILYADFGPTNIFVHGWNRDGMVWHVTPEGGQTIAASGMGDPNAVLVLEDGRFLVSDDGTDEIWIVENGVATIFTQSIDHPNGMVLSMDGTTLYVAQIFEDITPVWDYDGSIWALGIDDGQPVGEPVEVLDLGTEAGPDGLAQDVFGRLYIACWHAGELWRFDPSTEELVLICEGVPGIASLAFGQGDFDHHSIYATSTLQGSVFRIPVGVEGAELNR